MMMEGFVVVCYDGDMVLASKEVLFNCPNGPKFIKISEEMSLPTLRKAITNAIKGDGCMEYDCIELKDDNDVGKMFFIFSKFSSKRSIKLYPMVGQFAKEIFVLLHKPRSTEEIIALTCG
ncbi:hypothetical protein HKD37_18G050518 [Glycine soja]